MLDTQTFVLLWDATTFIGLVVATIATALAYKDREHQKKRVTPPREPVRRFARMRLRTEVVKLYFQASYFLLGTVVIFTLENPDRPISFIFWVLYAGVLAMVIESLWYLLDRRDIRNDLTESRDSGLITQETYDELRS